MMIIKKKKKLIGKKKTININLKSKKYGSVMETNCQNINKNGELEACFLFLERVF
jgi:hypothetical protein